MMDLLTRIEWRAPAWGLLALAPLLLIWLARRRRRKLAAYADAGLLPWAVTAAGTLGGSPLRRAAEALAWGLLALAAAGPRLPLEAPSGPGEGTVQRHIMSVVVALDVSASMAATDIAPDRLTRARLELEDLVRHLHGERLGLVVYAGRAGLLLPPTDDPALMINALAQAGPDLIETPGTNVSAALDLALATLEAEHARSRAVLLVTDAESDSLAGTAGDAARAAVARLRAAGIPLFILGVGSEAGGPIPLPDGGYAEKDSNQVVSRMDPAPYAEMAESTGGRFAVVADGDADWGGLYDQRIAPLPGDPVPAGQARAWRELYPWCLAPALALFMWAGLPRLRRRITSGPALLALALLVLHPAHPALAAQDARALQREAWQAWQAGRYDQALGRYARLGGYAGHMGAGAAAWRLRDYGTAARHFGAALLLARDERDRADALYDLGNAHYGLGHWQAAAQAYGAVLRLRPGDARAAANLAQALYRWARQTRNGPLRGDLRGRPGFQVEGRINPDFEGNVAMGELSPRPQGPLIDRGPPAEGARLQGEAARARGVGPDARLLASGLKKLDLLEDRPRDLLPGMLKQDTPPDAKTPELAPW